MAEPNKVELIDYFLVIWKRRWLVFLGTVACMGVASLVALSTPKMYQASLLLETGRLDAQHKGLTAAETTVIEESSIIVATLTGDEMMEKLQARIGWPADRASLRGQIQVEQVKGASALLEVSFRHFEPTVAVEGLRFLADQVIENHREKYEMFADSLAEASAAVEAQIHTLRNKMQENQVKRNHLHTKTEETTKQIQIEKKLIQIEQEQINRDMMQLELSREQLSIEKEQSRRDEDRLTIELDLIKQDEQQLKLNTLYREHLAHEIANAVVALRGQKRRLTDFGVSKATPLETLFLQAQLDDQQTQLANLRREQHEIHLREVQGEKQIAGRHQGIIGIKQAMATKGQRAIELQKGLIEAEKAIAKRQQGIEGRQKNDIVGARKDILGLKSQMTDLNIRNTEVEREMQELHEDLAVGKRFLSASYNTRIRSQPTLPDKAVNPRTKLRVALAGILGLFSTLILAFFLEYLIKAKEREG